VAARGEVRARAGAPAARRAAPGASGGREDGARGRRRAAGGARRGGGWRRRRPAAGRRRPAAALAPLRADAGRPPAARALPRRAGPRIPPHQSARRARHCCGRRRRPAEAARGRVCVCVGKRGTKLRRRCPSPSLLSARASQQAITARVSAPEAALLLWRGRGAADEGPESSAGPRPPCSALWRVAPSGPPPRAAAHPTTQLCWRNCRASFTLAAARARGGRQAREALRPANTFRSPRSPSPLPPRSRAR